MKLNLTRYVALLALFAAGPLHSAGTQSYDSAKSYTQYRDAGSPYRYRASDLIGSDVVNAVNETIGAVDDVVIERGGAPAQVVVSVGGFLGIGDRLVAVPLEELRISADGETIFLDATAEQLRSRREFVYNDGEPRGRSLWEERLQLREELAQEREDVLEARRALEEEKSDVERIERRLESVGG